MSVTTTSLGNHTTQITLSGETSSANFITALDTAITNAGWSQYDVSNQYFRVYRALNLDGTTYKIFAVHIDPVGMRIWTTSYESWDANAHVGTNEVWTYNRTGMMGYAYNNCDVIVMASQHWCVLQTFIRNQPSVWSGVFELMREANEDTVSAGYPCWCWTSSALLFCQPSGGSYASTVSLPRTRSGLTGSAAAINNSLVTALTRIGYTGTITSGNSGNAQLGSTLPNYSTYGWNGADRVVQSARVVVNNTELHGRIMGLKLAYNIGSPYNVASMTVDSNFNYSPSGTATNFWVLAANPTTSSVNVTNYSASGTGYTTLQSVTIPGGGRFAAAVGTGFYVSSSSGVYYVDASGTSLGTATQVAGLTQDTWEVIYDNVRYVYAATSAGIAQIDTQNNNTVVFISGTTSTPFGYLCWDGTYVWAVGRVAVANAPVYKIDPVGQTMATYNLTNASAGTSWSITTDGTNAYVLAYIGIYKVTPSGTVTLLASLPTSNICAAGLSYNGQYVIAGALSSNTATLYWMQLTTSGTVVQNLTAAPNTYGGTTSPYYKAFIGKIGIYDVLNNYSSYNLNFSAALGGIAQTGQTNTGSANGNPAWYSFNCDGNRAWGCYYSAGNFGYVTNLFHPDEVATTYGRLLLPQ